jgi:hypothetical protein
MRGASEMKAGAICRINPEILGKVLADFLVAKAYYETEELKLRSQGVIQT